MGNDIQERLIQCGITLTKPRRLIAGILFGSDDHLDAEAVFQRVREIDPAVGLATVYRALKLFEEQGLILRVDFGDGRARYEVAPHEHHDHLRCVRCQQVTEFNNPAIEILQREVAERFGYRLEGHRHELYGVCPTCQAKEAAKRREGAANP